MFIYLDTNHWVKLLDRDECYYKMLSSVLSASDEHIMLFSDLNFIELTQYENNNVITQRGSEILKYNIRYLCSRRIVLLIEALRILIPDLELSVITKYFTELSNNYLGKEFDKLSIQELFNLAANHSYRESLRRDNKIENFFEEIHADLKFQTKLVGQNYNSFEKKLLVKKLCNALITIGFSESHPLLDNIQPALFPSFVMPFFAQHANQRDLGFKVDWNSALDYEHGSYTAYCDYFITDKNNAHVLNIAKGKINKFAPYAQVETCISRKIEDIPIR